jgi:hypothetical protein
MAEGPLRGGMGLRRGYLGQDEARGAVVSGIRPEAAAALARWREPAVAAAVLGLGLWLVAQGGIFFGIAGSVVMAMGVGLSVTAWRRRRFASGGQAPGIVRLDEGAIAYFGPETGGVVALSELARVEARRSGGRPEWRLVQEDGTGVTIPAGAAGAEALFDVFAALPGAHPAAFTGAHGDLSGNGMRILWRRDGAPGPPRLPRG